MITRTRSVQSIVAVWVFLVGTSLIAAQPADAAMSNAAAVIAEQGLNGCSSNSGKALRDCVAGVLDRLADDIPQVPETQRAVRAAAAGVRAATNKAQALSAIALCQSIIASALKRVRAIGGGNTLLEGWGREGGLGPIANALARAARLIQTKG